MGDAQGALPLQRERLSPPAAQSSPAACPHPVAGDVGRLHEKRRTIDVLTTFFFWWSLPAAGGGERGGSYELLVVMVMEAPKFFMWELNPCHAYKHALSLIIHSLKLTPL